MKISSTILIGFILILCSCHEEMKKDSSNENCNVQEISFYTPDSIKIFGDLYELDKKKIQYYFFTKVGLMPEENMHLLFLN